MRQTFLIALLGYAAHAIMLQSKTELTDEDVVPAAEIP